MRIKPIESILEEANKQIKRLSFDESIDLIENHKTLIIDVREESEMHNSGLIKRTCDDGMVVYFGKELKGDDLVDAYTKGK